MTDQILADLRAVAERVAEVEATLAALKAERLVLLLAGRADRWKFDDLAAAAGLSSVNCRRIVLAAQRATDPR